jgi:hypothetical protein
MSDDSQPYVGASPWWDDAMAARFNAAWRAAGGIPRGYVWTEADGRGDAKGRFAVPPPPPRPPIEERINVLERLAEAEASTMCMAVGMAWSAEFSPQSMRRFVVLESIIDFLEFVRAHEPEVAKLVREIRARESKAARRS